MPRARPSKRTLNEFREWLVGWTLRTITDLFEGHGFQHVILPPDRIPSGQRRGLVEGFYAGIDLESSSELKRLLAVFEDILFDVPESFAEGKRKLIRQLERDGFVYENGKILDPARESSVDLELVVPELDTSHLSIYLERINKSLEADPELAVGSTKELLEATLKFILKVELVPFEETEDIPRLLKRVQKCLSLLPDGVDSSRRGADTIKRVLSNLGSVAIGVAELRNLYGSGHGRSTRKAIDSRLARLAVGAGGTLCQFLLETYELRKRKQVQAVG